MKASSYATSQAERRQMLLNPSAGSSGDTTQLGPAAQTATAVLTPGAKFIPVPVSLILGLQKAVEGQL